MTKVDLPSFLRAVKDHSFVNHEFEHLLKECSISRTDSISHVLFIVKQARKIRSSFEELFDGNSILPLFLKTKRVHGGKD